MRQVRRSFARAAAGYDQSAFLAREIDRRMLDRLDYVRIEPQRILDLGCATGASLTALRERYRDAQLLGADFCEPMRVPGASRRHCSPASCPSSPQSAALVAADAECLPFAPGSLGLIWSNLLLYWLDEPRPAFREAQRTLEVGGLFMFSTFGPDTLRELAGCFGDGAAHAALHRHARSRRHAGRVRLRRSGDGHGGADADLPQRRRSRERTACRRRTLRHERPPAGACRARCLGACASGLREAVAGRTHSGDLRGRHGHAWKGEPKKTADGRAIVRFERRPK